METRPRTGLMLFAAALALALLLGGSAMRPTDTGLGSYARVVAAERGAPAVSPQPGSDCLMLMQASRQRERAQQGVAGSREKDRTSQEAVAMRVCGVWETPPCQGDERI